MIGQKFVDPVSQQHYALTQHDSFISASFYSMASTCEVLIETQDTFIAHTLAKICLGEVDRIVQKFSRYLPGNVCHAINNSQGRPVTLDDESLRLLKFGQTCFDLSDGLMDLTSGILRRAWYFDGSDNIPSQAQIDALLPFIGWEKVTVNDNHVTLPHLMELDFGSIGKEYAVSKLCELSLRYLPDVSVLINLGGDIQVTHPRRDASPWLVGIESSEEVIPLVRGALASSGDTKRFLLKDGVRYSHIINTNTGWPVVDAPTLVTVHSSVCIQSGCIATIALLKGSQAIPFLESQDVQYWVRDSED